jgi:parvulin-like peptidyl-prolyl isomerase
MFVASIGGILLSGSVFLMVSSGGFDLPESTVWCQQATEVKTNQPQIVFQVGDYVMTAAEFEQIADRSRISSRETKLALVDSLVSTKLFSLAARAATLDAEAQFQKARAAAREQVLIRVYIERHVLPQYSEEVARQYFEAHKDELKYFSYYRDEIIDRLGKQAVAATNQSLMQHWKVMPRQDLKTLHRRSADASLVLVQVEDRAVTLGELKEVVADRYESKDISRLPVEELEDLLDWLVLKQLCLLEAEKTGLAHDPAVSKAIAESEDDLLAMRYLAWIQGKVGLEEAQRYYQAHPDRFKRPDQIWLRQIVVATEREGQAVKAKLAGGAAFEEVAQAVSLDRSSAAKGGDLGWVRPGRLPPELEKAAFQLNPKQISEPIKTAEGYVMMQVTERVPGTVKPFHEVASQILVQLKAEALEAERKRLMTIYKVTINEKRLD